MMSRFVTFSILLAMLFSISTTGRSQTAAQKDPPATAHARGTFDVQVTPLKSDDSPDPSFRRISINKQIHGDLEGTSNGEMLTSQTSVKDSGVYVAIERVTGKLNGRRGSFLLHHTGLMVRGKPNLTITVVPDSGTDELEGLAGTMNIVVAPDGKHSYDFEYSLPTAR